MTDVYLMTEVYLMKSEKTEFIRLDENFYGSTVQRFLWADAFEIISSVENYEYLNILDILESEKYS